MIKSRALSKSQKVTLGVFFGILGLMCFHPLGRAIVKIILPLGIGIVDLIGTGFFILFLIFVFYPQISDKVKIYKAKKNSKLGKNANKTATFIYELTNIDKQNQYVPSFMQVIDIGKARNQQFLVERFIEYYGNQTIKFIESKSTLSKYNTSSETDTTIQNISTALEDIKKICDNFVKKIIDEDILDIEVDITVLGKISISENLK